MDLETINRQIEENDRQRDALFEERSKLWAVEQARREAEAGDPQAGDLVIIKRDYGDARHGEVMLVEKRYHNTDRYDGEMCSLSTITGGSYDGMPLTVLLKINVPGAADQWKKFCASREALMFAIYHETNIFPKLY